MVTVSVMALLGLDEEPGTLEGYGPTSPEAARRGKEDPDAPRRRHLPEAPAVETTPGTTRTRKPAVLIREVGPLAGEHRE